MIFYITEILHNIMLKLDLKDLLIVSLVNKKIFSVYDCSKFWKDKCKEYKRYGLNAKLKHQYLSIYRNITTVDRIFNDITSILELKSSLSNYIIKIDDEFNSHYDMQKNMINKVMVCSFFEGDYDDIMIKVYRCKSHGDYKYKLQYIKSNINNNKKSYKYLYLTLEEFKEIFVKLFYIYPYIIVSGFNSHKIINKYGREVTKKIETIHYNAYYKTYEKKSVHSFY